MTIANPVRRRLMLALLTGVSSVASVPALAQTTAAVAAEDSDRGEIIVTATRREERLRDVPIAIGAVTQDDFINRGATRLKDIQFLIPGLFAVETSPGSERIQIRGISQQTGLPTVATYIDELNMNPNAVTGGLDIRAVDLERVEVLKGPQPTLYGENSMGGTIRYLTANPDLDEATGRASAEIGTIDRGSTAYRTEGAVSVPVVPGKFAIRVAAAYEDTGGYVDTGRGKDVNNTKYTTARVKALLQPSDTVRISAMYMHHEWNQRDASYARDDLTYVFANSFAQPAKGQYDIANLVATFDLGGAELLSSTGRVDAKSRIDVFFPFGFPTPGGVLPLASSSRSAGTLDRWTQEVRLSSKGTGPLRWLVGGTYADDKTTAGGATLPVTAPIVLAPSQTSKSWAIYGEGGYTLGQATLTLGARYFSDKRSNTARTQTQTFDTFNPRVNISVKTGESGIVYVNVAKGFRSGGFNNPQNQPNFILPGEETYAPEKLWTYEGGFKQSLFDKLLSVEGSIYYHDYKNIQSVALPLNNQPLTGRTLNNGIARGWGQELTFVVKPSSDLTATFAINHNDLTFRRRSLLVLPGDPLDNVPKWTTAAAIDYRRPISDNVTMFVNGSLATVDGFQSTLRLFATQTINGVTVPGLAIVQRSGAPFPTIVRTKSRVIADARIGADFGAITAYVYGANLTNDIDATYAGGVIQASEGGRPRPRTFGAGASFKF